MESSTEEWMAKRTGRPIESPRRFTFSDAQSKRVAAPFTPSSTSESSERESRSSSSEQLYRRFNLNSEPSLVPESRFRPFFDQETDGGSSIASSDSSFLGPIRRRRYILDRKNTDSDDGVDDDDVTSSTSSSSPENGNFENARTFSRKRSSTDTFGSMKAPKTIKRY